MTDPKALAEELASIVREYTDEIGLDPVIERFAARLAAFADEVRREESIWGRQYRELRTLVQMTDEEWEALDNPENYNCMIHRHTCERIAHFATGKEGE